MVLLGHANPVPRVDNGTFIVASRTTASTTPPPFGLQQLLQRVWTPVGAWRNDVKVGRTR